MGCCFSCFGICKSSPSTDARSRYAARANVGTTHRYSHIYSSNPYTSPLPSTSPILNAQNAAGRPTQSTFVGANSRTTAPSHFNYNAPTISHMFGNRTTTGPTTPLLKPKVVPTQTNFPSNPYSQTSQGSSQLNYQTFKSVTPVPVSRQAVTIKQVSKAVPRLNTTANSTTSNALVRPGRPAHHLAVNKNLQRNKTIQKPRTTDISKPRTNFDAIPLLCQILDSTPQNMKARLNVAQFFTKGHWEYPVMLEYINNSQAHSNFGIKVLSIIKICQRHVTEFRNRPDFEPTAHRMMLWHGSKFSNVRSILEHGLKLPEPDTASHCRPLFGNGIYFADRVSKSAWYCNATRTGEGCLFLCDVMIGSSYPSRNTMYEATSSPTGYQSVKGVGKYVPGPCQRSLLRTGKFYGSNMPLGKTVFNPDPNVLPSSYNINYNEFVVYDPDAVNIKFLVYFQFTDQPFVNTM